MKIVRKLLLSIIALVTVASCFTVSTYAWFQVNSETKVQGFDFKATGGLGFMISIDGETFANDLTSDQMKMAILSGFDSKRYEVKGNSLIDKNEGMALTSEEINLRLSENLLLSPVTSKNGVEFTNLSGTAVPKSSGKYVEFSLYFKATSPNLDDKLGYNIYLCGTDVEQMSGHKVEKTKIESKTKDTVSLLANMTILDSKTGGVKELGPDKVDKTIDVYSSNAARLSIKDEVNNEATIYEVVNEHDLGSYATDYTSATDTVGDEEAKKLNDRLYNSSYNAMYTYYNNLRPYSQLKAMKFEDKPKSVRDLTDEHVFTSVKSGEPAKKVTFRFWLEGWDADCFDGLTQSISVRLLFNSKPMAVK